MSAQPANQSNNLSTGVTEKVIETVKKVIHNNDLNIETLNHLIRKSAHFSAYLVLAILVLNALRMGGPLKGKSFVLAFVICALYASSDEFHQLFVPGRGAQVTDVCIDSSGAIVGIGLYILWRTFSKKRSIS
jgi:VanZ family protein